MVTWFTEQKETCKTALLEHGRLRACLTVQVSRTHPVPQPLQRADEPPCFMTLPASLHP